jgi:hypothetical protein
MPCIKCNPSDLNHPPRPPTGMRVQFEGWLAALAAIPWLFLTIIDNKAIYFFDGAFEERLGFFDGNGIG